LSPCLLAPGILGIGAFAYEGVIADAVRTVKTPGRHAAAAGLARLLWQVVDAELPLDGLPRTWVPSTPRARRTRGVEIPRLLAGQGAEAMLTCPHDRPDQTTLDARGRRDNTSGAFVARRAARGYERRGVPETVVCVDDVRTTGATLVAAGMALQAIGVRRVVGLTLAVAGRVSGSHDTDDAMKSDRTTR
jgi:predicted amidophosphoribosyltransferase